MPNLFDYFDCRPEMVLVLDFAVDQLVLLSNDFHLQMDCILLKCSILVHYEQQLVEQLDPISSATSVEIKIDRIINRINN